MIAEYAKLKVKKSNFHEEIFVIAIKLNPTVAVYFANKVSSHLFKKYCVIVELCRYPPNQRGLADPKTNSGYKTLIYYSAQANWRRPVLTEITREMMFFLKTIDLYHVV